MSKIRYILAIESSCDDTAAAVMRDGVLLSNVTAQQLVHSKYGGVVPELASRQHQIHIMPVVAQALKEAKVKLEQLSGVGFTRGPGLLGSLLVGTSFAKGLSLSLGIPLIAVHHMQAHVLAHFIEDPKPAFPFLCLTVSGGHTQIVKVTDFLEMELIGQTRDDAAGEAFDKTGKMLGLPYPAGPVIDKLAREGVPRYTFPEPRVPGLEFSFSGLKTAIRYFLIDRIKENDQFISENLADICASVQTTITTILLDKLELAASETGITEIAIAGGVSANSGLRDALESHAQKLEWNTYIPKLEYCTDNAAMIAITAHFKFLRGEFVELDVSPSARLSW
jgi:tRNA N6-adenosine threonylcarbamoyltransferase